VKRQFTKLATVSTMTVPTKIYLKPGASLLCPSSPGPSASVPPEVSVSPHRLSQRLPAPPTLPPPSPPTPTRKSPDAPTRPAEPTALPRCARRRTPSTIPCAPDVSRRAMLPRNRRPPMAPHRGSASSPATPQGADGRPLHVHSAGRS